MSQCRKSIKWPLYDFLWLTKLSYAYGPSRPAGAPNTFKQTARIKTICYKLIQIQQTRSLSDLSKRKWLFLHDLSSSGIKMTEKNNP